MKKNFILLAALTLSIATFAQDKPGVGIGTKQPADSAILDIKADKKGVLIPRVKLHTLSTAVDAKNYGLVGSPVDGVIVYNTEKKDAFVEGFYYWVGGATGKWVAITSSTVLEKVITDTKTEIQTSITQQIKEITNITTPGDPTDLSYMVAFKPDVDATDPNKLLSTGKLQYLFPKPDPADATKTIYEKREISFKELVGGSETVTNIKKFVGDGTASKAGDVATAPVVDEAKKLGKIFYTYTNEKNQTEYIDVTADFETIIKTNETIRKELVNVIKEVKPIDPTSPVKPVDPTNPGKVDPESYGNVYYGDIHKDGKPVLYSVDDKGTIHYINISQNIINEFINNPEVVEKIKESIRVEVGKGGDADVPTGETIGGKKVYKGLASVTFDGAYNSEPNGDVTVHPTKVEITNGKAVVVADATVKIGRLISLSVLTKNGSVVANSVTEVTVDPATNKFKFALGVGGMYTPIDGGAYDIVFEYLAQ